ncbi:hypothetical protein [Burkholderia pseudomallei]|uniref:hypothetical protein n=1 Tax=Burkholderia pseudomallei TaxID=28450 RepID=UPI0034E02432
MSRVRSTFDVTLRTGHHGTPHAAPHVALRGALRAISRLDRPRPSFAGGSHSLIPASAFRPAVHRASRIARPSQRSRLPAASAGCARGFLRFPASTREFCDNVGLTSRRRFQTPNVLRRCRCPISIRCIPCPASSSVFSSA